MSEGVRGIRAEEREGSQRPLRVQPRTGQQEKMMSEESHSGLRTVAEMFISGTAGLLDTMRECSASRFRARGESGHAGRPRRTYRDPGLDLEDARAEVFWQQGGMRGWF